MNMGTGSNVRTHWCLKRALSGCAALAVVLLHGAHGAEAATAGHAAKLVPHRAVYDVELDRSHAGSGIVGLKGRMVFEFTGSDCEGWTQNMRLVTQMRNRDDQASITDLRSSSWEASSGDRFRFNSSTYQNRKLTESTAGDATRGGGDAAVKVRLTKPKQNVLELPREVMFPVQHSIALLEAAAQGERSLQVVLYDGSDQGQKAFDTMAFISQSYPPGSQTDLSPVTNADRLKALASWHVAISYYERKGKRDEGTPSYEMTFRYYANGVTRRLFIDYGDFAIKGALKEIEFLEPGQCD